MCVCLCVFLYSSTLKVSSVCNDVLDIIEDKDQDLNEGIILETLYYSFISVFESITLQRLKKDIYEFTFIDIGYRSAPMKSRQVTKRY